MVRHRLFKSVGSICPHPIAGVNINADTNLKELLRYSIVDEVLLAVLSNGIIEHVELSARIAREVGADLFLAFLEDHSTELNVGMLQNDRLDFAKFDAMSVDLDLRVLSTQEQNFSVVEQLYEISARIPFVAVDFLKYLSSGLYGCEL